MNAAVSHVMVSTATFGAQQCNLRVLIGVVNGVASKDIAHLREEIVAHKWVARPVG